jgi:hypothetical protein
MHQFKRRWEWWFGFWQGEREGDLPLAIAANIVEQRAEQSYPGSVGG